VDAGISADAPLTALPDGAVVVIQSDAAPAKLDLALPSDGVAETLADDSLAVRFANLILATYPQAASISTDNLGRARGWDYNNGIVLHGIQKVYERRPDPKYLAYLKTFVDAYVSAEGALNIAATQTLDLIQPATLLLFLYEQTKDAKYLKGAATIRQRLDGYAKNTAGGFWHKDTYPNQMWLDGIFMVQPFLAKYGALDATCGAYCFDTPVNQITLLASHTKTANGLYVHAWDESKAATWADKTTGLSPEVWDRGLGWFAMALVDILPYLPDSHAGKATLLATFTSLAEAVKAVQGPTGLFYQVMDKGTLADNWVETSGSGMFVYALKTGVDRGYLPSSYLEVAQKGFAGLKPKITNDAKGQPVLSDSVTGMSVQNTYALYVSQAKLTNSPHGLCGILLAASAME